MIKRAKSYDSHTIDNVAAFSWFRCVKSHFFNEFAAVWARAKIC
jgi:hypothetical protein